MVVKFDGERVIGLCDGDDLRKRRGHRGCKHKSEEECQHRHIRAARSVGARCGGAARVRAARTSAMDYSQVSLGCLGKDRDLQLKIWSVVQIVEQKRVRILACLRESRYRRTQFTRR